MIRQFQKKKAGGSKLAQSSYDSRDPVVDDLCALGLSNLESHKYIQAISLFSRSQTRTPFYLKPFRWSFRLPSSVMSEPNSSHYYVDGSHPCLEAP